MADKVVDTRHVAAVVIPTFPYAMITRGQKAYAGEIMKDDIQSAIASLDRTNQSDMAIEDLSRHETFDVVMGKTTDTTLGVKTLRYVPAYLLVPEDIDTTLAQMK